MRLIMRPGRGSSWRGEPRRRRRSHQRGKGMGPHLISRSRVCPCPRAPRSVLFLASMLGFPSDDSTAGFHIIMTTHIWVLIGFLTLGADWVFNILPNKSPFRRNSAILAQLSSQSVVFENSKLGPMATLTKGVLFILYLVAAILVPVISPAISLCLCNSVGRKRMAATHKRQGLLSLHTKP